MKNAGFTLIELIAVITILSLLILLTSSAVTKILTSSKQELTDIQISLITSAAEAWAADNLDKLPEGENCAYITLFDLKKFGLITEDVLDANSNTKISDDINIRISSKNSSLSFEVNSDNIDSCYWAVEYEDIYGYKDASGASQPNLGDKKLVPVFYNGNNWIVADTNEKWYDYTKQEWANAVILKSSISKNTGDTVLVENENSEVLAMLVWIPRYEYKIEGQYGNHSDGTVGTKNSPGEIEMNFVSKYRIRPTDNEYIIHPAFDFGGEQLSGIWVGKFETTGDAYTPTILPSISSLRNQNINEQFETSKIFNHYLDNINSSHMMKNSEWGAVAYLSQSKYGKYGLDKDEVFINNCSTFKTGVAGDTSSAAATDICENTYSTEKGQKASTTGNITGVYDMSGGAFDRVMGYLGSAYLEGEGLNWGATSTVDNAKFPSKPEDKYFDEFEDIDKLFACNGVCFGQGLSETEKWYSDRSNFVSATSPWIVRGGRYDHNTNAGIFCSGSHNGTKNQDYSFRVVII